MSDSVHVGLVMVSRLCVGLDLAGTFGFVFERLRMVSVVEITRRRAAVGW